LDHGREGWKGSSKMELFARMEKILGEHPDLSAAGFRVVGLSESEFAEYREEFTKEFAGVMRAVRLLEMASTSKSCRVHSYNLKHTLERWMSLLDGEYGYLSNGSAILACYLLGIEVKPIQPEGKRRTNPNALVGINYQWYAGCNAVIDVWRNKSLFKGG
jgi:hypothetical protein